MALALVRLALAVALAMALAVALALALALVRELLSKNLKIFKMLISVIVSKKIQMGYLKPSFLEKTSLEVTMLH